MTYSSLIESIKEYNPKANLELIKKAYEFAKKAHLGQKRASGEDYFQHAVHVARILIELRADSATICAALLHDTIEDTPVTDNDIIKEFGEEIHLLISGVTKIDKMDLETSEERRSETLRKIILATTKDIRVILLKLADRLHNMRTVDSLSESQQLRISRETLSIYAQIAHKLGINKIKSELEDLSLKYLDSEAYYSFKERIIKTREERESELNQAMDLIRNKLSEKHINGIVVGRVKNFYSIYKKMKKRNKEFNEVFDLMAVRVITKTIPECYAALGVVHELFKPLPGRFKDYIALPKSNGYQSLHTNIIDGYGKIIEIQIRTIMMHNIAETGIAAHWKYTGVDKDRRFDKEITWLKQILEWKRDSRNASEFIETLKVDLFKDEIVVFTPQGDPISLPERATPVDFAYEIHTEVGNSCSKAKVNSKLVSLDYALMSGDIVEIITSKDSRPSRQWLSFVKTSNAKSRIRAFLNIKLDPIDSEGRPKQIKLIDRIEFKGKKSNLRLSKCCLPLLGDEIVGFRTKEGKVTVHKSTCVNVHAFEKDQIIKLSWKNQMLGKRMKLIITVKNRVGVFSDILNVFSVENINLDEVHTKSKKDLVQVHVTFGAKDEEVLQSIASKLKTVNGYVDFKSSTAKLFQI